MPKYKSILTIFLFGLLTADILAQTTKQARPSKTPAKNEISAEENANDLVNKQRARATDLIISIASDAPKWDDKQTAVRILADAADLLWDSNPARSRGWLSKAWELTDTVEEKPTDETMRQFWRKSERSRLKTIILNVASKRDAALSNKFLQTIKEDTDKRSERGAFDDRSTRSEQLLRLALGLVNENPALAANLAEQSLGDGVSFNFQTLLVLLKQKDAALANRLFDAALARVASNPNSQLAELQILQSYLFQLGTVFAPSANGQMILAVVAGQNPNASPPVDQMHARNFLIAAHRILAAQQPPIDEQKAVVFAREFVLLANTLAPHLRAYAPELSEPIAARAAQFAARLPKESSSRATTSDKSNPESTKQLSDAELYEQYLDDLEAKADAITADPVAKKLAYAQAAQRTRAEDYERGKRLAGKIEEEQLREEVLAFVLYRASLAFLEKGDTEKAVELALKTPQSLNRAVALISIAQNLINAKPQPNEEKWQADLRRQRALDLLFEAEKSLKREQATTDSAKVALGRISVLSELDKMQGVSALGETIALLNKLDNFDPTDASALRLGLEGFGASKFTVSHSFRGYGLRDALKNLVTENFDMVIDTLNNLLSPSVRGASKLEAARIVLLANPRTKNN